MTSDSVVIVLKRQNELQNLKAAIVGEKGAVLAGKHTKERYSSRGYFEEDITSCILTGKVVEIRSGYNARYKKKCRNLTVQGKDADGNLIICVFSEISRKRNVFNVVTIMPPMDKKRFGHMVS